jgi:hypothetical protein
VVVGLTSDVKKKPQSLAARISPNVSLSSAAYTIKRKDSGFASNFDVLRKIPKN